VTPDQHANQLTAAIADEAFVELAAIERLFSDPANNRTEINDRLTELETLRRIVAGD
jgi:hypothetical protein